MEQEQEGPDAPSGRRFPKWPFWLAAFFAAGCVIGVLAYSAHILYPVSVPPPSPSPTPYDVHTPSPTPVPFRSCGFVGGVSGDLHCRDWRIEQSGRIFLDIGQSTGGPINVTAIRCTQEESPVLTASDKLPAPVTIQSGGHAIVSNDSMSCYAYVNETLVPADGSQGTYRGRLFVLFVDLDTGMKHVIAADVAAGYENATPPTR